MHEENLSLLCDDHMLTYLSVVGNILPVRIAGIKIVRQPWFFSAVFTVLSPFLPTKLVSRVEFLGGDLEALKEVSILLYTVYIARNSTHSLTTKLTHPLGCRHCRRLSLRPPFLRSSEELLTTTTLLGSTGF